MNQVKNSNYLFGYGLPDEPVSATGLSAVDTKWAYDVIKAADPSRPVFLTDYANDISAYKNSADIFLNDQYPFNNNLNPMYDIKTKVVNMQRQVAPKPVWLIIQTGSQFGMPTNAQIRAETYLSIALGSTGLIFYSYDVVDAGGEHHLKKDGDLVFMKNLITELKNFSPAFIGPKNNNLSYSSSHVDAILRDYNGKSYFIAVNKSSSAQDITFTLNGFNNGTAKIGGLSSAGSTRTGQTLTVSSTGLLSDNLKPLEAVIYETSTTTTQVGVSVFQHCNYGGYSATLPVGSYNTQALRTLGVNDNDLSSIRVPAGYKITLFNNDNFTGNSIVKTQDDSCLVNTSFNDMASSIKVENSTAPTGMTSPVANGVYNLTSGVPINFSVNSNVARVLLYSSDAWVNFATLTPPFSHTWFPSEAGDQILKYEFYDSNLNFITGSSGSTTIKVNSSINAYFISPVTNNPQVSGVIHASVFASDPNISTQNGAGVESILFELYRGTTLVSSRLEMQLTYDWYMDTTAFINGLYTLKATIKSTAAAGSDVNVISMPITITN